MNRSDITKYLVRFRWFRSLMRKIDITFHCIVYREGDQGGWIARCLDLDMAVRSRSKRDAVDRLYEMLTIQIKFTVDNDNWDSLFNPSDKKEWDRYTEAIKSCQHEQKMVKTDSIRGVLDLCFV